LNVIQLTPFSPGRDHLSGALGWSQGWLVMWRSMMPRTDLLEQSATRVELDQRSRDARLRQEHVERALGMRAMPRQSLLRRFLRRLGSRVSFGGRVGARSADGRVSSDAGCRIPGETGGVAGGYSGTPPTGWPNCPRTGRASLLHPEATSRAIDGWNHECGRREMNSHLLSDGKY
jgi:hypothetical protein